MNEREDGFRTLYIDKYYMKAMEADRIFKGDYFGFERVVCA
jgi:hypothetical protein